MQVVMGTMVVDQMATMADGIDVAMQELKDGFQSEVDEHVEWQERVEERMLNLEWENAQLTVMTIIFS